MSYDFLAPAVVIGCLLLVGAVRHARSIWRHRRAQKRARRIYLYRGDD